MQLIENKRIEEANLGDTSLESYSSRVSSDNEELIIDTITSGLYSNPIGSIVRELVSNGIDATLEKGKIYPVIVKIGYDVDNDLSYFEVIDNGIGMSKDTLTKIYISIFESTKRNTDDLIGGFGIGSKSPLSLVDEIYITTIHNGIKLNAIYFKTNRLPDLTILSEEEVEDSTISGTSIKIYIDDTKVDLFNTEIYTQLRYFSNVIYVNEYNPEYTKEFNKSIIYENDYYLYSDNTYSSSRYESLHIALGNVYYPINFSLLNKKYQDYTELPLALRFDIGELEVTKSRENIKYTERVIQNIETRLDELITYIIDTQTKQLQANNLVDYFIQDISEFVIYNPEKNKIKDLLDKKDQSPVIIKLPNTIANKCIKLYTKEKEAKFKLNSYILSLDNTSFEYAYLRKYSVPINKGWDRYKEHIYFGTNHQLTTTTQYGLYTPDNLNTSGFDSLINTDDVEKYKSRIHTRTYNKLREPYEFIKYGRNPYDIKQNSYKYNTYIDKNFKLNRTDFTFILKEFYDKLYLHSNKSQLFVALEDYFSSSDIAIFNKIKVSYSDTKDFIHDISKKINLTTKYYLSENDINFTFYGDSLYPYFLYHNISPKLTDYILKNIIVYIKEYLSFKEYMEIKINNSFASIREAIYFHKQYIKDIKSTYINFTDIPESVIEDFETKVTNFINADNEAKRQFTIEKRRAAIASKKGLPKADKKVTLKFVEGDFVEEISINQLIENYDEIYFPLFSGKANEQENKRALLSSKINELKQLLEIKATEKKSYYNYLYTTDPKEIYNNIDFITKFDNIIKSEHELTTALAEKYNEYSDIFDIINTQSKYNQVMSMFYKYSRKFISDNRIFEYINKNIIPVLTTTDASYTSLYKMLTLKPKELVTYKQDSTPKRILYVHSYRKQDEKIIKSLPNYKTHDDFFNTNPIIRSFLSVYYTILRNIEENKKLGLSMISIVNFSDVNKRENIKYLSNSEYIYKQAQKIKDYYIKNIKSLSSNSQNYYSSNDVFDISEIENAVLYDRHYKSYLIQEYFSIGENLFTKLNITINNKINNYFAMQREFYLNYSYMLDINFKNFDSSMKCFEMLKSDEKNILINRLRELYIAHFILNGTKLRLQSKYNNLLSKKVLEKQKATTYVSKLLYPSINLQLLLPAPKLN